MRNRSAGDRRGIIHWRCILRQRPIEGNRVYRALEYIKNFIAQQKEAAILDEKGSAAWFKAA
jgi:hypothetical protein